MSTLLNILYWIVLPIFTVCFVIGIIQSFKDEPNKH